MSPIWSLPQGDFNDNTDQIARKEITDTLSGGRYKGTLQLP